jgi:hypothetical protein
MTFQESIRVCFTKYFDFSGSATRSEQGKDALTATASPD